MSVYWSGSCSQRPFFSGGRATLTGIRRLVSPRRRVVPARAVAMSPWADALAALRELPPTQVATVASLPRPAPAQNRGGGVDPGASFAASLLDKPSGAPDPLRSDPRPAAAQAQVAARKAARSSY